MTLFKLGVYNIKHNFSNYFSYFVSTLFSVFILFLFFSIYFNKQMEVFSGEKIKIYTIFKAGAIIVMIFSAFFIWYSNGFFIRSRKKELAIYSIVGMKKREVGMLLFCENMFIGVMSIAIGLPIGIITSKYLLQLLVMAMKARVIVRFELDARAVTSAILVFIILFLLNSINSCRAVYKFKLIELLSAGKEAEKAPEGSRAMAVLAVTMILAGYIIAYTKAIQGGAKTLYFGIIVLVFVVAGTYILFNNFIIILLNCMRKSKKLYYKGENLISISQLLYRIKGNSNTLASIAIISAIAITSLSCALSLYMEMRRIPVMYSPFSLMYKGGEEKLNNEVEKIISRHSEEKVTYKTDIAMVKGEALTPKYKGPFGEDLKAPFDVYIISRSQYNEILNTSELSKNREEFGYEKDIKLKNDNECFFIEVTRDNKKSRLKGDKVGININGTQLNLDIADSDVRSVLGVIPFQRTTIVVTDNVFNKMLVTNKENVSLIRAYSLNDSLNSGKLVSDIKSIIPNDKHFNSSYDGYTSIYELAGSYLFIGVFLGILFVISTGSILYYKQLIEAYEDKERYSILKKVGAKKSEIKHMVSKQLALIFGLPLFIGIFHSAAALCAYINYMEATKTIIEYVLVMVGVYIIIYLCYYMLSVKSYLKIVFFN